MTSVLCLVDSLLVRVSNVVLPYFNVLNGLCDCRDRLWFLYNMQSDLDSKGAISLIALYSYMMKIYNINGTRYLREENIRSVLVIALEYRNGLIEYQYRLIYRI